MSTFTPQLKDASLFQGKNWVNNQWVESVSGKRFDVTGMRPFCHLSLFHPNPRRTHTDLRIYTQSQTRPLVP